MTEKQVSTDLDGLNSGVDCINGTVNVSLNEDNKSADDCPTMANIPATPDVLLVNLSSVRSMRQAVS